MIESQSRCNMSGVGSYIQDICLSTMGFAVTTATAKPTVDKQLS